MLDLEVKNSLLKLILRVYLFMGSTVYNIPL